MSDPVSTEVHDGVLLTRIDSGKVNALSTPVINGLVDALDRVRKDELKGFVLTGKPGIFTAGFDLKEAQSSSSGVAGLFLAGSEVALRILELRCPAIIATPGHAVAMGAVLLLCADYRIGTRGPFKIGLNEVSIGMNLPPLAIDLVQARMSKRWANRAAALAEMLDPETAVDAGFLDRVVDADAIIDEAIAQAKSFERLDLTAYGDVKRALRGDLIDRARASVAKAQARK